MLIASAGSQGCGPPDPVPPFQPDGAAVPAGTLCPEDSDRCLYNCDDSFTCGGTLGLIYDVDCAALDTYMREQAEVWAAAGCWTNQSAGVISFFCAYFE